MVTLSSVAKILHDITNSKSVRRGILGIIDFPKEEIDGIIEYLNFRRMNIPTEPTLEMELEQSKFPVLRELSVIELDFVLMNSINLDGLKNIALAKGGAARGLATIKWDKNLNKFGEVSNLDSALACIFILTTIMFSLVLPFVITLESHVILFTLIFIIFSSPIIYPASIAYDAKERLKKDYLSIIYKRRFSSIIYFYYKKSRIKLKRFIKSMKS